MKNMEEYNFFYKMHDENMVSWTTMVGGYAIHEYNKDVFKPFDLIKHLGIELNNIIFVYVLLACNLVGLVDEGCKYFNNMSDSYYIIPSMNNYICIIDLIGHASLEKDMNFIANMPKKPKLDMWMFLLGACRLNKNVRIGDFMITIIFWLEPKYDPFMF